MALDQDTRDKLAFLFTKVGLPSDVTDWLDAIPESASIYVADVQPTTDEAMNARTIMLMAGIPAVYFRAMSDGLVADDYQIGDPPPGTMWFCGAHAVSPS